MKQRSMRSLRRCAVLAMAGLLVAFAGSALAQEKYPSRAIEYIVPWGPGGGAD